MSHPSSLGRALIKRFTLKVKKAIDADPSIKLIFLCSPGNPTGTLICLASLRAILDYEPSKGIVVVDEAYIDFSQPGSSAVMLILEYANLCVMQSLSKSFGFAAIRCVPPPSTLSPCIFLTISYRLGMALAQPPLIQVLTNAKAPCNISTPVAHLALHALSPTSVSAMREKIETLRASRAKLLSALHNLKELGLGHAIGAQDANFILIPVFSRGSSVPENTRAQHVHKTLAEGGVVVRYRGGEAGCPGCLRITVGTEEENAVALEKLQKTLEKL
jgi:histidinol-phosphate aminotransferase